MGQTLSSDREVKGMNVIDLILNDYTLGIVSLGSGLLGLLSGVVGSFAVVKKQGILADAIAHAGLPGIAAMFIVFQTKNSSTLLLGALFTGILAAITIQIITRYSRIKADSAMALILASFFGLGMVMLTSIQKHPNANQAGLDHYIFGQASTILMGDLQTIVVLAGGLMIMILLIWKELKLTAFDPDFARSIGFSSTLVNHILAMMMALTVILGISMVGVILMTSLLIAPGVAARQWTQKLSHLVFLAAIIGMISGLLGSILSALMVQMPTGPMIVLILSFFVIFSLIFAPHRGLIRQWIDRGRRQQEVMDDLLFLPMVAKIGPIGKDTSGLSIDIKSKDLNDAPRTTLLRYKKRGMVYQIGPNKWAMTQKGIEYYKNHALKRGIY